MIGATAIQANMSAIDEILLSEDESNVLTIDMKVYGSATFVQNISEHFPDRFNLTIILPH